LLPTPSLLKKIIAIILFRFFFWIAPVSCFDFDSVLKKEEEDSPDCNWDWK